MTDIDIKLDDDGEFRRLKEALEEGVKEGAKESTEWGVDEGKHKAQDLLRIGHNGHPRIWKSSVYHGFKSSVTRTSDGYHGTLQNVAEHAPIVEMGRRAGNPPPVQKLMEWVVSKLSPANVYIGGEAGDGFDNDLWYVDNSSPDSNTIATSTADDNWKDSNLSDLEYQANLMGMSPEDYKEEVEFELQRLTHDADMRIRADPEKLEGVLQDGEYKTQFQFGIEGTDDDDRIRRLQKRWIGYGDDTPDHQRPIYGYLNKKDGVDNFDAQYFGDVRIELKRDRVEDKTTFIDGDSGIEHANIIHSNDDDYLVWALETDLLDPNFKGIGYNENDAKTTLEQLQDMDSVNDADTYFEFLYHGQIKLDDIEEVVFTEVGPDEQMKDLLNDAGISWRVL